MSTDAPSLDLGISASTPGLGGVSAYAGTHDLNLKDKRLIAEIQHRLNPFVSIDTLSAPDLVKASLIANSIENLRDGGLLKGAEFAARNGDDVSKIVARNAAEKHPEQEQTAAQKVEAQKTAEREVEKKRQLDEEVSERVGAMAALSKMAESLQKNVIHAWHKVKHAFAEYISEPFNEYVVQPLKDFGKTMSELPGKMADIAVEYSGKAIDAVKEYGGKAVDAVVSAGQSAYQAMSDVGSQAMALFGGSENEKGPASSPTADAQKPVLASNVKPQVTLDGETKDKVANLGAHLTAQTHVSSAAPAKNEPVSEMMKSGVPNLANQGKAAGVAV